MNSDMQFHDHEHKFEKSFWSNCANTLGEELKQLEYAKHMSLVFSELLQIDVSGKRILDIGGGPVSLLLKCINAKSKMVIDPIRYPDWVYRRYEACDINFMQMNGEDVFLSGFDEVWIYNVLQHCMNPQKVLFNALRAAPVLRIFEWLDIPPHPGHPHMLTESFLSSILGNTGRVTHVAGNGCYGNAFSGVFMSRISLGA